MNKNISVIVAMSKNGIIGNNGKIPWHIPEDLRHFKKITMGHSVIMGRKTYESIIKTLGHQLDGRKNIVLTRQENYNAKYGCVVVKSFEEAVQKAGGDEIFVIGGAEIYKIALPHTQKIYLTTIDHVIEGDTSFPKEFDWLNNWKIIPPIMGSSHEGLRYHFKELERVDNNFINLHHARNPKQKAVLEQIKKDGVCPFCEENLFRYHNKPIIKNGKWWILTENFHPYVGTKFHFILIYKPHAVNISELSAEAGKELFEILSWLETEYKIKGGGFFMRFGDMDRSGSTVDHLHAHIVSGESSRSDKGSTSLKVKLGYKKSN